MRAFVPVLTGVVCVSCALGTGNSGFSTDLVPAVGAGPVTLSTVRNELAAIFGDSTLADTSVHMGEGYFKSGTEVLSGTDLHLRIVWSEDGGPDRITALGSAWTAPEGVTTGMTLGEVEELAGPFRISGFGWDYGGTAHMAGTPLEGLLLRFRPPDGAELVEAEVLGDCLFDSDHPGMRSVNPVLKSISVLSEEG